jgi:hypothetical protein
MSRRAMILLSYGNGPDRRAVDRRRYSNGATTATSASAQPVLVSGHNAGQRRPGLNLRRARAPEAAERQR